MGKKHIVQLAAETTKCLSIHLAVVPEQAASCLDSNFGGPFYLPEGGVVPTHAEGLEMECLAQLNFAKLPHLEGFPKTGLLQFFLCTDDAAMQDMADNATAYSSDGYFQVIYYPDASDASLSREGHMSEERWPMEKITGGMAFGMVEETATLSIGEHGFLTDLGCEDTLGLLTPQLLKKAGYDLSDCPDTDQFCIDFGNWGHKIGGHPAIRQGDVRLEDEKAQAYSVLLFQFDLTSPGELEAETFCFFIKPEDLSSCRFDDILLVWHNCY